MGTHIFAPPMHYTDYCDAIRLVNSALAAVENHESTHEPARPSGVVRRLRELTLELDLLRARLRQGPVNPGQN